ncbi:WD domain protein, partial [Modicella reniformis]
KETATPEPVLIRNESTSHVRRKQQEGLASPLAWRSFAKDDSILKFLADRVQQQTSFKQQLCDYIKNSKSAKKWRIAAANAITILVRTGESFHGEDLRGICIPGANLSDGVFDSALLQGANLRLVELRGTQLRGADLSKAQMEGVQFGMKLPTEDSDMESCACSPDGRLLAVGLSSGDINVYTISNWQRALTLKGHTKGVSSVIFSPSGDRIASGSSDKTVRLWDVTSGNCNSVAHSPQEDLDASASDDKTVRPCDAVTDERCMSLSDHTNVVYSVAFSPKGTLIVTSRSDKTVRLWDTKTDQFHEIPLDHEDVVNSVTFSPNITKIALGCENDTMWLWDVESGKPSKFGDHGRVECVAFSPLGDMLASVNRVKTVPNKEGDLATSTNEDREVRLWDVKSGKCLAVVQGCQGKFHDIAWGGTSEVKSFIIACIGRSVCMWKVIQDKPHDQPRWKLLEAELVMTGASIQDVRGLSLEDEKYLKQRGAIGQPTPSQTAELAPSQTGEPAPSQAGELALSQTDEPAPSHTDEPASSQTDEPAPSHTDEASPQTGEPVPSQTAEPAPSQTED